MNLNNCNSTFVPYIPPLPPVQVEVCTIEQLLTIVSSILGLLFVISEMLGLAKCKSNSITELLIFSKCIRPNQPSIGAPANP